MLLDRFSSDPRVRVRTVCIRCIRRLVPLLYTGTLLHFEEIITYSYGLLSETESSMLRATTCSELFLEVLELIAECSDTHADLLHGHLEAACALSVQLLLSGSPEVCARAGETLVALSRVDSRTQAEMQSRMVPALCTTLRRRETELTDPQLARMCVALAGLCSSPAACGALLELSDSPFPSGNQARIRSIASVALADCVPSVLIQHISSLCDRVCGELGTLLGAETGSPDPKASMRPPCRDARGPLVALGGALLRTLTEVHASNRDALLEQLVHTVEQASDGRLLSLGPSQCTQLLRFGCCALAHGLAQVAHRLLRCLVVQECMVAQRVWLEALGALAEAEVRILESSSGSESLSPVVCDRALDLMLRACTLLGACSTTDRRAPKFVRFSHALDLDALHNSGTLGFQLFFMRTRIRMLDAWIGVDRLLIELVHTSHLRDCASASLLSPQAVARRLEAAFVELGRLMDTLIEVGCVWTNLGLSTLDIEMRDARLLHELSLCATLLPQLLSQLLPDGIHTDTRLPVSVQALAREFSTSRMAVLRTIGESLLKLNQFLQENQMTSLSTRFEALLACVRYLPAGTRFLPERMFAEKPSARLQLSILPTTPADTPLILTSDHGRSTNESIAILSVLWYLF